MEPHPDDVAEARRRRRNLKGRWDKEQRDVEEQRERLDEFYRNNPGFIPEEGHPPPRIGWDLYEEERQKFEAAENQLRSLRRRVAIALLLVFLGGLGGNLTAAGLDHLITSGYSSVALIEIGGGLLGLLLAAGIALGWLLPPRT